MPSLILQIPTQSRRKKMFLLKLVLWILRNIALFIMLINLLKVNHLSWNEVTCTTLPHFRKRSKTIPDVATEPNHWQYTLHCRKCRNSVRINLTNSEEPHKHEPLDRGTQTSYPNINEITVFFYRIPTFLIFGRRPDVQLPEPKLISFCCISEKKMKLSDIDSLPFFPSKAYNRSTSSNL